MFNKKISTRAQTGLIVFGLLYSGQAVFADSGVDLFKQNLQLTSEQLVMLVLLHNPDLTATKADWDASKAVVEGAGALDDPQVSYSLAPQTLSKNESDIGHTLSISQQLPWPGKLKLREDVARFESDVSHEGIIRSRLRLILASKIAFSDWYFVHAALRINKVNQSLLQEFHRIAEIKYASGRTSRQDVLRAEVEVALLQHRDIVLQRQRRETLSTINTLLQRMPDLPVPIPNQLAVVQPLPSVTELRKQALSIHPELRVFRAQLSVGRARLALSERDFYPDIKLSATYNTLWNQDEKRLALGVSINIPLRNKRRAASTEKRTRILYLDAAQQSKIAQVLDTLQRAYEQVLENEHVLNLFKDKLLPLAEENLAAAQSDYESGSGGFLDLVSAEKNLMQTQLQLEQARADYLRRWASLEHATGGPLEQPQTDNTRSLQK